jgi:anti-sigma factor RsiW
MHDSPTDIVWLDEHGHLAQDALHRLVDGDEPTTIKTMVDDHVRACPQCQREIESLRSTVSLLQSMPEVDPPRSFVGTGYRRTAAPPTPIARPVSHYLPVLRVAAAAVLVMFIAVTAIERWFVDDTPQPAREAAPTTQAIPAESESTSLGAPAPAAQPAASDGARAAGEPMPASDTDSLEAEEAAPQLQEERLVEDEAATDEPDDAETTISGWRIAQLALAVALAWIVVTWIGLERTRRTA